MSAPEVKKRTAAVAVQPESAPAQATSTPATTTPATPAPQAAPAQMASGAEVLRAGAGPVRTDNPMMPSQLAQTRIEVDTPALKAASAQPSHKDATLPKTRSGNIVDGPVKVEAPSPMPTAADTTSLTTRYQPKKWTNEEIYEYLSGFTPKTPEELAKERKRHKREAIISAIGDGISAISNLVYTTKYAPNAYTGKDTLSERNRARWEKARKAYDDDLKGWIHGRMAARKADRDAGQQSAILELKQQAAELKQRDLDRRQRETDLKVALGNIDIALKEGKVKGQDYINQLKALEVKAKADGDLLAQQLIRERIKTEQSKQWKNYNAKTGGSGGGKPGEYPWYDSDGTLNYAHSYEAMRQNAINNGTWNEATQESVTVKETKDRRGNTKSSSNSTLTKPAKGHSSKPAPKPKESDGIAPPSRRKTNDNTPPSRRKQ